MDIILTTEKAQLAREVVIYRHDRPETLLLDEAVELIFCGGPEANGVTIPEVTLGSGWVPAILTFAVTHGYTMDSTLSTICGSIAQLQDAIMNGTLMETTVLLNGVKARIFQVPTVDGYYLCPVIGRWSGFIRVIDIVRKLHVDIMV